MKRREFSTAVRVEIVERATRGVVTYCEGCGLPVKKFHLHHVIAEGYVVDKSKKLTAKDGQLLCIPCHAVETVKRDVPGIAQAKARQASHIGAKKPADKKIPQPPKALRSETKKAMPPRRLYERVKK